jgi:hypothetical protein
MQENNTTLYEVTTVEELITGEVETTVGEEVSRGDVGFTPDSLSWSLPIMGKGMLGIFVVTAVIVLVVNALNNIPEKKNKKNKD